MAVPDESHSWNAKSASRERVAGQTVNENIATWTRRIAALLSHYRAILGHNVGAGRVASAPAA
jgi:hypothetical protein